MSIQIDWQEIADRSPKGYLDHLDGKKETYGPVKEVRVSEDDMVIVTLQWAISRPLNDVGIPATLTWDIVSKEPCDILCFPNLLLSYCIEDTPEKGLRVRFQRSVLYFEERSIQVDPSTIPGLLTPREQTANPV